MNFFKILKESFGRKEILQIEISKETMNKICELSKETYPKEFLAFFEGRIFGKKIMITDIIFQPYIANENSAWGRTEFPSTSNVMGSIHSHPGPRNKPSRADLHLFGKTGIVHGIIKEPYTQEDMALYDNDGTPLNYKIK